MNFAPILKGSRNVAVLQKDSRVFQTEFQPVYSCLFIDEVRRTSIFLVSILWFLTTFRNTIFKTYTSIHSFCVSGNCMVNIMGGVTGIYRSSPHGICKALSQKNWKKGITQISLFRILPQKTFPALQNARHEEFVILQFTNERKMDSPLFKHKYKKRCQGRVGYNFKITN